jgi:hypothetical protein
LKTELSPPFQTEEFVGVWPKYDRRISRVRDALTLSTSGLGKMERDLTPLISDLQDIKDADNTLKKKHVLSFLIARLQQRARQNDTVHIMNEIVLIV